MKDEQISVVCFYWDCGSREYTPHHVNALAKSVHKHLSVPHRFVCVYDAEDISGFDDTVELIPLPDEAKWTSTLSNPTKPTLPSSYRRLWAFSKEAKCLGDRILMLDIDCLVVGDLLPLFEYSDDDFVGWRPDSEYRPGLVHKAGAKRIGGGTWLLRTGKLTHIWENFSIDSIMEAKKAGWKGSDQAWLSYNFAKTGTVFPRGIGIYGVQDTRMWEGEAPENSIIIHFNGKMKSWETDARALLWYCKLTGVEHDPTIDTPKIRRIKQAKRRWERRMKPSTITFVTFWWDLWPKQNEAMGLLYIRRLFDSIARHLPRGIEYRFVLFTDKPKIKLNREKVEIYKLKTPSHLKWNLQKMYMYSSEAGLIGPVICFDLDVVIVGSLASLISQVQNMERKLLITCQGAYHRGRRLIGGSIIGFKPSRILSELLWRPLLDIGKRERIEKATDGSERKYYHRVLQRHMVAFWERYLPGSVLSYKRDCKNGLSKSASIVRFHGNPRPHQVQDDWVLEHWR